MSRVDACSPGHIFAKLHQPFCSAAVWLSSMTKAHMLAALLLPVPSRRCLRLRWWQTQQQRRWQRHREKAATEVLADRTQVPAVVLAFSFPSGCDKCRSWGAGQGKAGSLLAPAAPGALENWPLGLRMLQPDPDSQRGHPSLAAIRNRPCTWRRGPQFQLALWHQELCTRGARVSLWWHVAAAVLANGHFFSQFTPKMTFWPIPV